MLIRNWNVVDDDYLNVDEIRQHEDMREVQYQQDTEEYKLSVGGLWFKERDEYGDTGFVINPKDALVMHLPECKRIIAVLGKNVQHAIEVWHWRPVARLDVDTAQTMLNYVGKDEARYIVQHEDGWVSNDQFSNCYHWQIATPYTLENAYRIAKAHRNLSETIGDCQEVWILVLGWTKENMQNVKTR